jgi:acylphosphatase
MPAYNVIDYEKNNSLMKCYQINLRTTGVEYLSRYYIRQMANNYGICGFVKRIDKTSLLIEAEGVKQPLADFIHWCDKGSVWARTNQMQVSETTLKKYAAFHVL